MHEFIHVIWVIVLLQIVIILIRLTAEVVLNNKSKFEKISLMFVSGKIRWLSWAMKEEWCCKWVDPALKGEKVTCACRGASCLLSSICGVLSSPVHLYRGVPQGSILSPLLFFVYMNDLPLLLKETEVDIYVDNTTIWFSGTNYTKL